MSAKHYYDIIRDALQVPVRLNNRNNCHKMGFLVDKACQVEQNRTNSIVFLALPSVATSKSHKTNQDKKKNTDTQQSTV